MKTTLKILLATCLLLTGFSSQAQIRIGIIGLDTSHSPAFVRSINAVNPKPEYTDFRVVAAYPYGSRTIKSSYERIPRFTEEVKKYGVKIVDSIEELLKEVDCVILATNDGNLHLEQAVLVFKSGKPVFIDKPIGANLAQAIAIFELAEKYQAPVFSSSSLRYSAQNQSLRNGDLGKIIGVDAVSPARLEPTHADLAWYGIHGVEILYTVMGTGCVSVQRTFTEGSDFVVGKWDDGRIGTVRGIREGKSAYGGSAITENGIVPVGGYDGYDVLLIEMVKFFRTSIAPVSKKETLEIFAFIEAADVSRKKGGVSVTLHDVKKKSQKDAQKLIKSLR